MSSRLAASARLALGWSSVPAAVAVVVPALLSAPAALAQEPQPVYQEQDTGRLRFHIDALLRQEWTQQLGPSSEEPLGYDSRQRGQLRPRLELDLGPVTLGVGGDLNYSSDENDDVEAPLLRDNYDSRDARLDLAFARIEAGPVRLAGGRFEMPLPFTEMLWDRDLRPQGGLAGLEFADVGSPGGLERLRLTGLAARGSHVFDDRDTNMVAASAEARFARGPDGHIALAGSFVRYTDLDTLDPRLLRQNTRQGGRLSLDYDVLDFVLRLGHAGSVSTELVADYCRNLAADADNQGLWLAVVLGSTETAQGRLEYVYAKVDRDATVGAYATDDFLWATGWAGHRVDLGVRLGDRAALHVVGQLQRFKDSPVEEDRDRSFKRLRIELRLHD